MNIFVLGREKELCVAELVAKFGGVELINEQVAEIDADNEININSLGGSIKTGEVLRRNIFNTKDLEQIIVDEISKLKPTSKFNFGISYYGSANFGVNSIGVKIKKSLKKLNLKARLVLPKTGNELNAASIKHNKLISKGAEFVVVQSQNGFILARTTGCQDIDAYSKRDYEKPCRDRKVGMLPPKLSQIMINLAQPSLNDSIVDPFCGSGGLLMEASLMGHDAFGSDISQEMIVCSKTNTEWFEKNFNSKAKIEIEPAQDATQKSFNYDSYSIVTEGFLGQNFLSKPTKHLVKEQLPDLKRLYIDFFKNVLKQPKKPKSICVCMPIWIFPDERVELNLIDEIINLGYTISKFKSVRQNNLYYYREGQFTGRQILVFRINQEKTDVKD